MTQYSSLRRASDAYAKLEYCLLTSLHSAETIYCQFQVPKERIVLPSNLSLASAWRGIGYKAMHSFKNKRTGCAPPCC